MVFQLVGDGSAGSWAPGPLVEGAGVAGGLGGAHPTEEQFTMMDSKDIYIYMMYVYIHMYIYIYIVYMYT